MAWSLYLQGRNNKRTMKKLALFFLLFTSLQSQAQGFGIPLKTHPYYNLIEWKGRGGLLMARSPKDILNQIELSLVGDQQIGLWDQKFNPKLRDAHYISTTGANHIYFLDELDLKDNGKATYNQINGAGNIKSMVLNVGIKVKAMKGEYDYNTFELIDANITEKAFVYQHRYFDKKNKEYHELAVFMTHHNLACEVIELGYYDVKNFEKGLVGQWQFAGFKGEEIFYAQRVKKNDVLGWTVRSFDYKGELIEDHFLFEPENVVMFENIGYGTTGKYHTNNPARNALEKGVVSFMNDEFHVTVLMERNGGHEIVLLRQDDEEWEELNSVKVGAVDTEIDQVRLGAYPIEEGITYRYKHNGIDKVGILYFEAGKEGHQEDFTEVSVYNPSRLLIDHEKDEFVTKVGDKILSCDLKQFKMSGGINFKHR